MKFLNISEQHLRKISIIEKSKYILSPCYTCFIKIVIEMNLNQSDYANAICKSF